MKHTAQAERSLAVQLRDATRAFRNIDITNEELVTQFSLRVADLYHQVYGDAPAYTLTVPNVAPIVENEGEKVLNRVYFRAYALKVREAKLLLVRALRLEYIPNGQKVVGGELVQISIPLVTFTACDKLAQKYPEIFQSVSPEKLAKFGISETVKKVDDTIDEDEEPDDDIEPTPQAN